MLSHASWLCQVMGHMILTLGKHLMMGAPWDTQYLTWGNTCS